MKRLLIISGMALCFSALPAFAQRGCSMHGMGGPGFGMGGMHGSWGHSWGQMSRGSGTWMNGAGRAASAPYGTYPSNMQAGPAARAGGVSPWRRMAGALGFAKSRPNPASTKGTTDVPETLHQGAPHNGYSVR